MRFQKKNSKNVRSEIIKIIITNPMLIIFVYGLFLLSNVNRGELQKVSFVLV